MYICISCFIIINDYIDFHVFATSKFKFTEIISYVLILPDNIRISALTLCHLSLGKIQIDLEDGG